MYEVLKVLMSLVVALSAYFLFRDLGRSREEGGAE
jgi:hypothetical protein